MRKIKQPSQHDQNLHTLYNLIRKPTLNSSELAQFQALKQAIHEHQEEQKRVEWEIRKKLLKQATQNRY